MTKPKVKIIQRKHLANSLVSNALNQRINWLPIYALLASIAALLFLRVSPRTSKLVSRIVETSVNNFGGISVLWSPIAILAYLSVAAILYMWMDFQHHKKPLIRIAPKTKYSFLHHLRIVVLPRFHYRWRPAFYWVAVAEVCTAVFVATVIIVGLPSAKAFSGSGLGSEEQPYIISDCAQLQEMRDDRAGFYELGGPIDCTMTNTWNGGVGFDAIGRGGVDDQFTGTLDGKGFAINGLYQRIHDEDTTTGLIGVAIGATVKNLKLTNVDIAGDYQGIMLGPFASQSLNSSFSDISVTGSVLAESNSGAIYTSGFTAVLYSTNVTRVSVDVNIINNSYENNDIGKGSWAGGLVVLSRTSTIIDSYTTGSITGTFTDGTTSLFAGGFAGQVIGGSINNSYSNMNITIIRSPELAPSFMIAGGFIGMAGAVEINNSFAAGQMTLSVGSMEHDFRGGFIAIGVYDQAGPPFNVNMSGSGNRFDAANTQQSTCVGIYSNADIDQFRTEETPNNFCSAVNVGNAQPNYFKNNNSNIPLNEWDFSEVWKTQANALPNFTWQVAEIPAVPGKVRSITSSSPDASNLTAQWLVPLSDGNSSITNYAVQYKLQGAGSWSSVSRSPSTNTSQLISGLVGGQPYDIRVAAINAIGQGDWEDLSNVYTRLLPTSPRNVIISGVAQTGELEPFYYPKLDWQEPEIGAPITDYVIQYKPRPGPDWAQFQAEYQDDYGWAQDGGTWTTINDGANNSLSYDSTNTSDSDFAAALFYNISGEVRVMDGLDFRVAAINAAGQGDWTATQTFRVFIGLTQCQQMHDALEAWPNMTFNLMNSIDCNDTVNWNGGEGWQPLYDTSAPFRGLLDGKGFTIDGLHINAPSNATYPAVAFMSNTKDAIIQNLTLSNVSIFDLVQNDSPTGSLIGAASPDTTLDNITVSGVVSGKDHTGGVVGVVSDFTDSGFSGAITWQDIDFSGSVTSPDIAAGLLGSVYVDVGSELTLENVQTHGSILADSSGSGGVVGGFGADAILHLQNVSSDLDISGDCKKVTGGILGSAGLGSVTLDNVVYSGDITCQDLNNDQAVAYVGGLIGVVSYAPVTITNSSSTGQITMANGAAGGLVGIAIYSVPPRLENPTATLADGLVIHSSSSSMNIEVQTSATTTTVTGGLVATASSLDIADSHATGTITVNDGSQSQYGVTGSSGGLVGLVGGPDDGGGLSQAVGMRVRNSYASVSIDFSAVSPTEDSMAGPMVGGIVGLSYAWLDIQDSYATGDIAMHINQACQLDQCDNITAGMGGVGGILIASSDTAPSSILKNSYATGQVTIDGKLASALMGGLAGSLQGYDFAVQNVYATGSVGVTDDFESSEQTGTRTGGLFGDIRVLGLTTVTGSHATGSVRGSGMFVNQVGLGASGGLIGNMEGQIEVSKSYATGNIQGAASVGGLVGSAGKIMPNEPRAIIRDTYATGTVSGLITRIYYVDLSGYVQYGSAVGGLVGTLGRTDISSSYASGVLTSQQPLFADQTPLSYQAIFDSSTGGLVGTMSITQNGNTDPTSTITNSFSSSTVQSTNNHFEGMLVGRFLYLHGPDQGTLTSDDITGLLTNNYYDAYLSTNNPCANWLDATDDQGITDAIIVSEYSNATVCKAVNLNNQTPNYFRNSTSNQPLNTWDFSSPIWYRHVATYPTFDVGESPPGPPRDLAGIPTTSSVTLSWAPPISDGGAPVIDYNIQYRLNGTTTWLDFNHSPSTTTSYHIPGLTAGARYDFQISALNAVGQSGWVLGIFDVLVPGTPAPPATPSSPSTPTGPTRPTRPPSGTNSSTPVTNTSPIPEGSKLVDISKIPASELPGLVTISPRKVRVSSVPYFFLSWLLLLALYFAYRAWREYRYQKAMTALIARAATTSHAVSDFLAITTHYLNTPLSILKGAMELIASKHALRADFVQQFQTKLAALQATTVSLTSQAELGISPASSVVVAGEVQQQDNSRKQLWIPLLGIALAITVTDVTLLFTKSYDHSWGRLVNHLIWAVFGVAAAVVSYSAWRKQRQIHTQRRQELEQERSLLAQKNLFVAEASQKLAVHARELQVGTQGLEQFPDTKLLVNGLTMLSQIAEALGRVQRFAALDATAPNVHVRDMYEQNIAPTLARLSAEKQVAVTNMLRSDTIVQMQPDELSQILRSTVENAIGFSPANGFVQLSSQNSRRRTTLLVKDTGTGISSDMQAHMFEPLTRGTDTTTFDHPGLGLNLFITRMILQKHGGDIQISSSPSMGTTVTMTVPRGSADPTGHAPQVITPTPA